MYINAHLRIKYECVYSTRMQPVLYFIYLKMPLTAKWISLDCPGENEGSNLDSVFQHLYFEGEAVFLDQDK